MKPMKKKRKSREVVPETSISRLKDKEKKVLNYYAHDPVELIHQIFSSLKPKEIKFMAPHCIKNYNLDKLKEICTQEVLGMSVKRLNALMDGVDPPSNTESSSSSSPEPEQVETISLDSISSDEEILSQNSSKNKKRKHKKRKSKHKHKCQEIVKKEKNEESSADEKPCTSNVGSNMYELIELQARAKAIRAQLQTHQLQTSHLHNETPEVPKQTAKSPTEESDGEVEIKTEPVDVVEISSEEEKDKKPNVEKLKVHVLNKSPEAIKEQDKSKTITKCVNDLVITVPQSKQTRKIKLKRNKVFCCDMPKATTSTYVPPENKKEVIQSPCSNETIKVKSHKKSKFKKKEKNKQKVNKEDGSDHDEITLQLSDTEKMDLLEDLDRKNYNNVSDSSKNHKDNSDSDNSANSSFNLSDKDKEEKQIKKIQTIDVTLSTDENTIDTDKAEKNTIQTVSDEETNNSKDLIHCAQNLLKESEGMTDADKLTDNELVLVTDSNQLEDATESANINVKECLDQAISHTDDKTVKKKKKKSKKKSKKCNDEKKAKETESKNDTNL